VGLEEIIIAGEIQYMHIMVLNEKIYELPVFLVMIALVAEA
jgi:hypothetical protein